MFKNLEVEIELTSPVVFGRYPLQLDSLIYWALNGFIYERDKTLEAMESVIKRTDEIFHASQAVTSGMFEKVELGRSRSNNLFTSLSAQVIMPEHPVNMSLNTITKCIGFQIKKIKFYCVGHKQLIFNLLNQLNGIGCFSSSGYGQIGSITINEIEDDFSFIKNENLNKILPQSFIQKHGLKVSGQFSVQRARYIPPYIDSKSETCLIPFTELRSK